MASAAVTCVAVLAGPTPSFAAQAEDAGDVVVVASAESRRRVTEGGSTTEFSLRLPEGASCPGDSANDGFRIQSFIVPAADDPGALRYKSTKPDGDGRWALYDVLTNPYVQAFTAEADGPGKPGLIVNIPTFSYAVFPPGELADGPHHIGIACTLRNETFRYWDTEVVLTRTPEDSPAQIRWRVVSAGAEESDESSAALVAVVAAVVFGVVIAVAIIRRRHQSVQAPISAEDR